MEANTQENLWGVYTEKMGWYGFFSGGDGMQKEDLDGKKARMKRVADTMWHTFNSHNFAEVFRNCYHDDLRDPALAELRQKIGGPCHGYTHDLAWALIGMNERADWSTHYACGWSEMVQLTLRQIAKNDGEALDAVKHIIEILRK